MNGDWSIDLGRYETIDPHTKKPQRMILPVPGWRGAHWIVAGSTGSGKTNTNKLALGRMAQKYGPKMAFAVCDPHLTNFKRFAPRASSIGFGRGSALTILDNVEAEMDRRYQFMFDHDIEEWTPEHATLIGPYLVVLIEELISVMALLVARGARSIEDRLVHISTEMRKTGGGLILSTNSPKAKVISGLILEQCPIRWCGRTERAEQTEAVLETRDYPCHLSEHPKGIRLDQQGVAYVRDGFRVRRGRSDGIQPDVFAHIAADTAGDRFDFGWPHEIHPIQLASARGGTAA